VQVCGAEGGVLVLDAGTGIRRLGIGLSPEAKRVDILLSHLHMDHIVGLGFFRPLFMAGMEVHIWGPPSTTHDMHARLSRYLSHPLFPVPIRELACKLTLHDVPRGCFAIGSFDIFTDLVSHPGPTVGYRIEEHGKTLAYLPDHEPALGATTFPLSGDWTSGFAIAAGADVLIHDCQYDDAEYPSHVGWGHSSIKQTLAFAEATHVRHLVTFHHDPAHDDDAIDAIVENARNSHVLPFELTVGAEGHSFEVVH
jgi:ribonuclease BN (tRNA processing enzyme)